MTQSALLNPTVDLETTMHSTSEIEAQENSRLSANDVLDLVNEILGYDVLEVQLMAEGYRTLGTEMLGISDAALGAQAETLPEE